MFLRLCINKGIYELNLCVASRILIQQEWHNCLEVYLKHQTRTQAFLKVYSNSSCFNGPAYVSRFSEGSRNYALKFYRNRPKFHNHIGTPSYIVYISLIFYIISSSYCFRIHASLIYFNMITSYYSQLVITH